MCFDNEVHNIVNPAPVCVVCGKPLNEIGGYRLIAQQSRKRFVGKSGMFVNENGPDNCSRSVALSDNDEDGFAMICGESDFCSSEALDRIVDAIKSDQTPWFCQKCGKRTCSVCNYPINRPVASAYIAKNLTILNCPILPIDTGCINPECDNYRSF